MVKIIQKTRRQLIEELEVLHQKIAEYNVSEFEYLSKDKESDSGGDSELIRVSEESFIHEFSNIVSIILMNISLAKKAVNPEDEIYENLSIAEEASRKAKNLIQRLFFQQDDGELNMNTSVQFESRTKRKVMLMDNDEDIREIVGNIMYNLGYEMGLAKDSDEAVALYKEAHNSGKPFHAVIMDLFVPNSTCGKETVDRLKKIDPNVKVILLSGAYSDNAISNFKHYGIKYFVHKPFKFKDLFDAVDSIIMNEGLK